MTRRQKIANILTGALSCLLLVTGFGGLAAAYATSPLPLHVRFLFCITGCGLVFVGTVVALGFILLLVVEGRG